MTTEELTGFFWLFVLFVGFVVIPMACSYNVCKERNRDPMKGFIVTLFFGWLGVIGMYVCLKERLSDGVYK